MAPNTIHSIFLNTSEKHGDNIAFYYLDRTWKTITYGAFASDSKAIASSLIKIGISKGDRIAIFSENRHEWCASYLGIMIAGAIAVPIDSQLNSETVRNLLIDSESKVIFFSSKTETIANEAATGLEIKKINLDSPDFKEICGAKEAVRYPETSPENIASIIYTSGTTGIPKGVMLTHRNFCSDAEALVNIGIITKNDNVLSLLPLHHTYPFMSTFLVPLFLGTAITYSPSLKGPDIISSMRENGVTILVGVPQLLEMIRNGITDKFKRLPAPALLLMKILLKLSGSLRKKTGINITKAILKPVHNALGSRFRFFASGGAKLDPQVMEGLEALGFTVLEGYGITETSPVVTFNPIDKRKAGSAGKPLPSAEIKIIKPEDGRVLGTGEEGEVAIKGPMVMKGYYKNPQATEQAIRDNYFFSGDLGYIDRDGYLFITGRIKEVIVLGSGKNIYPEEVEKEYSAIPLIKEICAIGIEEKGRIEALHAIIVPDLEYAKKHQTGNIHEALVWEIAKISGRLPSYQRLKGFSLYPEPLPRTPLGKLRRFMIKDLIKEKFPPRAGSPVAKKVKSEDKELMADETGRNVVECIKSFLKEPMPVQSMDNLELDLGLDSLQRIELVVSLENKFSIKLPETFASDIQTVGEIVEKMKGLGVRGQGRGEFKGGVASIFSQEPEEAEKKKIGIKQGLIGWFFVSGLMLLFKLFFRIFFRLEAKGIENIPHVPFIIAPNHCSNLDGFAIGAAIPLTTYKTLYFQGFQKYFTGRLTAFFARLAHVIPIDPETYLGKALQLSAYVLKNNKALCIFPEGGRSYDGKLMEFKKGIGILALELNVPVVPAYIEGSFEALPKGAFLPKPAKIKITFGKPFYPSELDLTQKPESVDKHQFFADELMGRVKSLKR
ncbi:MAG: AMP-binding protein [Thermodesulfovibrionales bacterium]|nr:AMP-binding protein [Thermodesulfovibrionales bacterium]